MNSEICKLSYEAKKPAEMCMGAVKHKRQVGCVTYGTAVKHLTKTDGTVRPN